MIGNVNQLLADDAQATGRAHQWGPDAMHRPLIEAFNHADVMVSDVSGIVVDFMASMKPLVMYAAQFDNAEAFRASHPTAAGAYVITAGLETLDQRWTRRSAAIPSPTSVPNGPATSSAATTGPSPPSASWT